MLNVKTNNSTEQHFPLKCREGKVSHYGNTQYLSIGNVHESQNCTWVNALGYFPLLAACQQCHIFIHLSTLKCYSDRRVFTRLSKFAQASLCLWACVHFSVWVVLQPVQHKPLNMLIKEQSVTACSVLLVPLELSITLFSLCICVCVFLPLWGPVWDVECGYNYVWPSSKGCLRVKIWGSTLI